MAGSNKFDRSVSMVAWAYNEEDLIDEFLERASQLLDSTVEDYEIILIDDGSTDKTNEIAKAFQEKNPRLKIFKNETNLNVGISSQRAINMASKEYVFWQTIDWSYDISYLRVFLKLLKSYDLVAGVRREPVKAADRLMKPILGLMKLFGIKHITRRSDTVFKAIISVVNYILIRCLFNLPLSDYQNVVIYPTKLIQSINFEANSSFTNPEGLLKCHWKEVSIVEVPISFIPRQDGEAKGTRLKAIKSSIFDIVRLWFKWIILGRREKSKKGLIKRLNPNEWNRDYEHITTRSTCKPK